MKSVLLILFFFLTLNAHSKLDRAFGEWGSGGGNALVCFEPVVVADGNRSVNIIEEIKANKNTIPDKYLQHIESIELFDLYEAKKRRGLDSAKPEILAIKEDEKFYDYFERLGSRFEDTVYFMKGMVDQGKELLPDSRIIFHDFAVEYQNDLGSVTLPGSNCLIITMAAQVNYNDFYEVHVDERLFNHPKHTKQSRATLILHELIYAVGRKHFDQTDSGGTRNIVRQYISYHPSITEGTVAKSLFDLGFAFKTGAELEDEYRYSGIIMALSEGYRHANEHLKASLDMFVSFSEGRALFEKMRDTLEAEGLSFPVNLGFIGFQKMLTTGFKSSAAKDVWLGLEQECLTLLEGFKDTFSELVEEREKQILANIKNYTMISNTDFENLVGHVENFFNGEYSLSSPSDMAQAIERREDRELLLWEVYLAMRTTICRGTSGPIDIDVPISKERGDEVCYEPLKLDNIIPKK